MKKINLAVTGCMGRMGQQIIKSARFDKNFNLDQEKVINFIETKTFFKNGKTINKKTKKIISALVVVHIFGVPANFYKLYSQ